MPNKLKNLNITKVDLVPEGANPDAFVTMYKSKTPIRKSGEAESFAAKLKDIKLDDVVRQIWQYTESLSSSLISILKMCIRDRIIAGETRLKASKLLQLDKVPCIIADELTDEQIKAFRLIENKTSEFATWDFEKLQEELKAIDIDLSLIHI